MRLKSPVILLSASALLLAACAEPGPDNMRTAQGAATGALIGGFLGATRPGEPSLGRTATGAVIGGVIGGMIGQTLDRQAADLRAATSGNVAVQNTGNSLVLTMPQDLLFATDSATLRPDLQRDLREVARNLTRYPDSRIEIVGHTDNTGAADYNRQLSQRRADAVAAILRSEGVSTTRIVAFGRGEDAPVATNLTPEGRTQNRRVEIVIYPTT